MLNRIIRFSINNKLVIGLFTLALIAWGTYSVTHLSVDAVPDITNNQVQVITSSPSNGAEDIERFVTFPVEQTLATIPDIEEIRSFSRFGLSVVTVVFKEEVDVYWARQQVSERLNQVTAQIPAGMGHPEMAPVTTGLGEIYQYIIAPKKGYENKYTAMELRTIQDWMVRRQMLGVEGVADVSSFGGYLKQYEIVLNPEKLRSMNLSIKDVFDALEKNNQNTGGAYIDKNPHAWFVRSIGLIGSISDIENIVVKNTSNGIPILIRNIGEVQFGAATRYGALTHNDEGEVTGGVVLMLKGANSSAVIKRVKERVAQIEKTLPEGVMIEPFLDRTKMVNNAIKTVETNLLEGALIVIFVLVVMLGNMRAGLIVASVIPLSMLFAVSMMNLFGVSGNLMSLGAIDFGLIVDGAVIIVEATVHHLGLRKNNRRLTQFEMDNEVFKSASGIRNSAAFGEIIILIVYLPILALVGIEGKMFKPMAQTVSFAILGAFLLSITYVPMMSALVLNKNFTHKRTISDRIMDFFQRIYNPVIKWVLNNKLITVGTAVVLFVISLIMFNRMGAEFIPTLDEGDFSVETRVLTGSSLSKTVEAANKSAAVLMKKFPEVEEVVGKIGSSEIPTDPMPIEACDLIVVLKDRKEWTSAKTREELANKMQAELESNIPGVAYGFLQPIQMRFNEMMTGARQDVVVKVYGENLDELTNYANKIGAIARNIKGAEDIYIEQVTGLPQVVVHFKRELIAQYGLNIEDINQAIRAGFAGEVAGLVFEGEKRFDMVVRLDKENRQNIDDLKSLYITAPNGNQVPLSQLADVEMKVGPNQIQREDAKRRIIIGFNVRGRDVESIVEEIQKKIDKEIRFAPGYYATYGGMFENLQEAKSRLSIAVPAALLLILVLLYFTFGSLKYGLLIFTAIPLSAIGGVFALWLRGMPFSISAGVGFIALFGVAVLNGIVLIAAFNRLKKEGMKDLKEIIFTGTRERLRPVIMTALVASLGFIPMALSHGSGAEVQRPLATVVIGGLVTATLLTLLVLPCLYVFFEKIKGGGNKNPKAVAITILLLFAGSFAAKAQSPAMDLPKAIETAIKNNPSIHASLLEVEHNKLLKKTAADFGKTSIGAQFGQANSVKWDNHFSLSQSIPNPSLFRDQKRLADAQIKGSELNVAVSQNELIYQVKTAYYQLAYYKWLQQLWMGQDTVFSNFLKAAALRYKTGETNLLEKTTAETQLNEIKNRLRKNESDIRIYQSELQRLLNTDAIVDIQDEKITKLVMENSADSISANNPSVAYLQQQIEVNDKTIEVEKARGRPDFSIGYFNQSIYGYQNTSGTEQFYDFGKRFQGVQAGINIPLFNKPNAYRVKAARVEKQITESNFKLFQNNLQGRYRMEWEAFESGKRNLAYYEQSALPNAALILKQAQKAFQSGEIGYVEYLQALKTNSDLQLNYLQAVNEYNQSVITLQYLAGNK